MKNILITAAMRIEALHLIRKLALKDKISRNGHYLYQNKSDIRLISLIITGIGPRNSLESLKTGVRSLKPDLIVNSGSAGALHENLKPGRMIIPGTIMDESGNKIEIPLNTELIDRFTHAGDIDRKSLTLITRYKSLKGAKKRREIHQRLGADMVDMEAYPQAELASSLDLPFFCLKVITDNADRFAIFNYWRMINRASKQIAHALDLILNS